MNFKLLMFLAFFCCFVEASTQCVRCFGRDKRYSPKNGVLNFKAIVFGGAFRVSTALPLHGDFQKYNRLEIVQLQSHIGNDVPLDVLTRLTQVLRTEMERGGRFGEIAIVDSFQRPDPGLLRHAVVQDFREADSLEHPLRTWEDLQMFDEQRRLHSEDNREPGTLVLVGEVIDYAKGNKLLQLIPIDMWNNILTVRFSYYDAQTGEELGRQIVSSDNASKVVPGLVSPRGALTGVVEGLLDQVTRRKLSAER